LKLKRKADKRMLSALIIVRGIRLSARETKKKALFSAHTDHIPTRGASGGLYDALPDSKTIIINEELCTVGSDHAVITWFTPGQKADTSVYMGRGPVNLSKDTFQLDTEYHYAELSGLEPSTRYWYQVESNGARGSLNAFITLPRPEGKRLFSFALLSDAHLTCGDPYGDINEIYLGKLNEYSADLLIQCILDSKKRNVDLAVIPGDLTDSASRLQYQMLRDQLLPRFGNTPYLLCPGNHDKFTKTGGLGERGFLEYAANREKSYTSAVFRDCLFLLVDSCRQDDNLGYVDREQIQWIESTLKGSGGIPSYLFLHHPCNGFDVWFGVKNYRELQKAIRPFAGVQGIFCGHMHRSKVTTNDFITGSRPYVVVPATVQFPCAYAVVRVHERGFEYNTYKVSRLDLSEMSRERVVFRSGGRAIYTWYSFGSIGDRSFSYSSGRLYGPKQYELSFTSSHARAAGLYDWAQSFDGASLAYAESGNMSRVILGRYESFFSAVSAYREKLLRYGVRAVITKDGGIDRPWR
jgi:hypothetical protein